MDADHPDIAAAVKAAAEHGRMAFGGVQAAADAVATLVNAVLQNHLISKASTFLDHLNGMGANGELIGEEIKQIAGNFKTATDLIPVAVGWIKGEFAKPPADPSTHPAVGFFRRPPSPLPSVVDEFAASQTFMSHCNSTAQMLAQLLTIQGAEAALLNTIAAAVTTIVSHPVISPEQAAALTAALKKSTDALNAAIAAAKPQPH